MRKNRTVAVAFYSWINKNKKRTFHKLNYRGRTGTRRMKDAEKKHANCFAATAPSNSGMKIKSKPQFKSTTM